MLWKCVWCGSYQDCQTTPNSNSLLDLVNLWVHILNGSITGIGTKAGRFLWLCSSTYAWYMGSQLFVLMLRVLDFACGIRLRWLCFSGWWFCWELRMTFIFGYVPSFTFSVNPYFLLPRFWSNKRNWCQGSCTDLMVCDLLLSEKVGATFIFALHCLLFIVGTNSLLPRKRSSYRIIDSILEWLPGPFPNFKSTDHTRLLNIRYLRSGSFQKAVTPSRESSSDSS